jgi:putative acetyltransferase
VAVTFRRATNADVSAVQQLVDRALRDYGLSLVLDAGDIDLSDLEHHYDARGGRFELLESDGALLGVVGWRPAAATIAAAATAATTTTTTTGVPGDVIELKKLYLAGAARGQGLGRQAVMRVIDAARARGARAIVLETAAVLREANRLYTRLGFVPVCGQAAGPFATLAAQCDRAYRLELDDLA